MSFEPRSSIHYLGNIALVTSVIQSSIPKLFGQKESLSHIQFPPPICTTLSNIIPSCLTKQINSKGLQLSSRDLRYACVRLLIASFEKLSSVLDMASAIERRLDEREGTSVALLQWSVWRDTLFHELRHTHMPDAQIIISLFSKKMNSEPSDDISTEEYHCAILDLLAIYQRHNTDHLRESHFDFGKIVPVDFDCSVRVQMHVLRVLECVPDFKWYAKNGSMSHFGTLMKTGLESTDCTIKAQIKKLLHVYLQATFLFQDASDLIQVLWSVVSRVSLNRRPCIIEWIDKCIVADAKVPFTLVKRMMELKKVSGDASTITHNPACFPPILICLLDGLKADTADFATVFLVALINDLIPATGMLAAGHEFVALLETMDVLKTNTLLNLSLQIFPGNCKQLSQVSWKKGIFTLIVAKNILERDNTDNSLYTICPSSFHGNWSDASLMFPSLDFAIYADVTIPMMANDDAIPEVFDSLLASMTVSNAQICFFKFNDARFSSYLSSFIQNENDIDAMATFVKSFLYHLERESDPKKISRCLFLIIEILEKPICLEEISQIVFGHNAIRQHFYVEHSDSQDIGIFLLM